MATSSRYGEVKPWERMRITRKQYAKMRPWKNSGMSREKFESMLVELPDEVFDVIYEDVRADILTEAIFNLSLKDD